MIPAKAIAKVSFRLVGEQDPDKIREAFRAFVRERLPVDCTVEFANFAGSRRSRFRTTTRRWPRRAQRSPRSGGGRR